jgi:hypothetical protein
MMIKVIQATSIPHKRADVELHFPDGPLKGLKLVGFSVWESDKSPTGFNVTVPSRQYQNAGQKRSFSLLRYQDDAPGALDALKHTIYKAYCLATKTPLTGGPVVAHQTPKSDDEGISIALSDLVDSL